MKNKAVNKYLAKVILLTINENQQNGKYLFQINCNEDYYALYVFNKESDEIVCSDIYYFNFKDIRRTKRKILKMMEER